VVNRALALLALALVLSGCSFGLKPAGATTGRVGGHVTVRVCGGANTENQSGCQAHPSPGVTLAFKEAASGRLSQATTDASGAYAITLSPGSYEVTLQPGDALGKRGNGPPRQVTVIAGKAVTADFGYTIQLL
jgi:hypothetical protein